MLALLTLPLDVPKRMRSSTPSGGEKEEGREQTAALTAERKDILPGTALNSLSATIVASLVISTQSAKIRKRTNHVPHNKRNKKEIVEIGEKGNWGFHRLGEERQEGKVDKGRIWPMGRQGRIQVV